MVGQKEKKGDAIIRICKICDQLFGVNVTYGLLTGLNYVRTCIKDQIKLYFYCKPKLNFTEPCWNGYTYSGTCVMVTSHLCITTMVRKSQMFPIQMYTLWSEYT